MTAHTSPAGSALIAGEVRRQGLIGAQRTKWYCGGDTNSGESIGL